MTQQRLFYTLFVILILVAALSMLLTLAVAQLGRNQAVVAQQQGCIRGSHRNAALVNQIRASAIGNQIIATDPKQPARTRRARGREALVDVATVGVFDPGIDRGLWREMRYPVDRQAVKRNSFTCAGSYPLSGLIP